MSVRSRRPAIALIPILALGLTACVGGPSVEIGSEPPSSFTAPVWSLPTEPVGEWLTSVASDDVRIDVYQAGVKPATEDSLWAYSDTDEPIFNEGEPIVVLHLVLTNTGDDEIVLPSANPEITANYESLDLSSLPPESRFGDIVDSLGIAQDGAIDYDYSIDNDYQGLNGGWEMPVAPGESIAWPAVYMYLTDGGFEMRFRVWEYTNGIFNYSATVFDSGFVDIPLT
jgi:hypothetical protein